MVWNELAAGIVARADDGRIPDITEPWPTKDVSSLETLCECLY